MREEKPARWRGNIIFVVALVVIIGLVVGYLAQIFLGYNGDITAKLIVELVMFCMGLVWGSYSISSSIKKWKGGEDGRRDENNLKKDV